MLPNGQEINYEQPPGVTIDNLYEAGGGNVTLLKIPGHTIPARSDPEIARDERHGWEWRDHALLCGGRRRLGGQDVGNIYIDTNGVPWRVLVSFYATDTGVTFLVRLIGLLGRFPLSREFVDLTLIDYAQLPQPVDPPWTQWPVITLSVPNYLATEANSTGSRVLCHLYSGAFSGDYYPDKSGNYPNVAQLMGVYALTISGAGNLDDDQLPLGAGISASVALYKDSAALSVTQTLGYQSTISVDETRLNAAGLPTLTDEVTDCCSPPCSGSEATYQATGDWVWPGTTTTHTLSHGYGTETRNVLRIVFDSTDSEVEIAETIRHERTTTFDRTHTGSGQRVENFGSDCPGTLPPGCVSSSGVMQEIEAATSVTTDSYRIDAGGVHIASAPDRVNSVSSLQTDSLTFTCSGTTWNDPYIVSTAYSVTQRVTLGGTVLRDETSSDIYYDSSDVQHPGDDPKGMVAEFGFALTSGQIASLISKRGVYPSAGADIEYTEIKIGPHVAAQASSPAVWVAPNMTYWYLGIHGSYQPVTQEIEIDQEPVCFV